MRRSGESIHEAVTKKYLMRFPLEHFDGKKRQEHHLTGLPQQVGDAAKAVGRESNKLLLFTCG